VIKEHELEDGTIRYQVGGEVRIRIDVLTLVT